MTVKRGFAGHAEPRERPRSGRNAPVSVRLRPVVLQGTMTLCFGVGGVPVALQKPAKLQR